jgi:hypothetical protein
MLGVLPKGPGVGPDGTLPHGGRSRNGSGTLPFKIGTSTSVDKSRGTRHGEYGWYSGLG